MEFVDWQHRISVSYVSHNLVDKDGENLDNNILNFDSHLCCFFIMNSMDLGACYCPF